jgi:hypothetical protein
MSSATRTPTPVGSQTRPASIMVPPESPQGLPPTAFHAVTHFQSPRPLMARPTARGGSAHHQSSGATIDSAVAAVGLPFSHAGRVSPPDRPVNASPSGFSVAMLPLSRGVQRSHADRPVSGSASAASVGPLPLSRAAQSSPTVGAVSASPSMGRLLASSTPRGSPPLLKRQDASAEEPELAGFTFHVRDQRTDSVGSQPSWERHWPDAPTPPSESRSLAGQFGGGRGAASPAHSHSRGSATPASQWLSGTPFRVADSPQPESSPRTGDRSDSDMKELPQFTSAPSELHCATVVAKLIAQGSLDEEHRDFAIEVLKNQLIGSWEANADGMLPPEQLALLQGCLPESFADQPPFPSQSGDGDGETAAVQDLSSSHSLPSAAALGLTRPASCPAE